MRAASRFRMFRRKSSGISLRNIGVKSPRPSFTARLAFPPINNELLRNIPEKQQVFFNHGNYRPQRSWAKVMFLQVCVILFTGGVSASVHAGIPPPWSRHPQEQTPPWEQTPPGADPPGADPPDQTPSEPSTPPGTKYTPLPPGSRLRHMVN